MGKSKDARIIHAAITYARDHVANDELEIDDSPATSRAPDTHGTWVAAWVWIPDHVIGEGK